MSALVLWPSRVTPGTLVGEFRSSSGVLPSASRVTPGAIAQSCHAWISYRVVSHLELLPANLAAPASYFVLPIVLLLDLLPRYVTT